MPQRPRGPGQRRPLNRNVWPPRPLDEEHAPIPEDVEPMMAGADEGVSVLVEPDEPGEPAPQTPRPDPAGTQDLFGASAPPDLGGDLPIKVAAAASAPQPQTTGVYQDASGPLGPPDLGQDVVVNEETAADAIKRLRKLEADLKSLIDALEAGADTREALHTAQVEGTLTTDDNLVRLQAAQALQEYLINLGGLILDVAAVADGLEGIKEMTSPIGQGQSRIENFDKLYEFAKDFESGVNTLVEGITGEDSPVRLVNDPGGIGVDGAISDDPRLAAQTLKSHASDLISILKEAEEKGFKGDFRQTGLTLAARVLKSMAEAQLELRKIRRALLEQTLAGEQTVLGVSYSDWMRFEDARFDAIDELVRTRAERFALESAVVQRFPAALITGPQEAATFNVLDPHATLDGLIAGRPTMTFNDVIFTPDPLLADGANANRSAVQAGIDAVDAAAAFTTDRIDQLNTLRDELSRLEIQRELLVEEQTEIGNTLSNLRRYTWEPFGFQLQGDDPLMRERQSAYRGVGSAISKLDDRRRELESQLGEVPILEDRLTVLEERKAALLVEQEADAITEHIADTVVAEAEAARSARRARVNRLLVPGLAILAGAAILAVLFLGGGSDDPASEAPAAGAAASTSVPTAAAPAASDAPATASTPAVAGAVNPDLLGSFAFVQDGVLEFTIEGDRIIGRTIQQPTWTGIQLVGQSVQCPEFASDVVFDLDLTGEGEWFWFRQPCERLGGAPVTVDFTVIGATATGAMPPGHPDYVDIPQGHAMIRIEN